MESKKTIYLLMFTFGTIGGYIPTIWGVTLFSFSSILFNAIGAIFGIWVGFTLTR